MSAKDFLLPVALAEVLDSFPTAQSIVVEKCTETKDKCD
jgi:hypothetical protein